MVHALVWESVKSTSSLRSMRRGRGDDLRGGRRERPQSRLSGGRTTDCQAPHTADQPLIRIQVRLDEAGTLRSPPRVVASERGANDDLALRGRLRVGLQTHPSVTGRVGQSNAV